MARSEARIFTHIWTDQDFTHLPAIAQWLYFFLLSQPSLTLCGVLDYHPARWARFAAGTDTQDVTDAAAVLQAHHFLTVDTDTDEIWIRTLIKNDVGRGGPKLIIGVTRAWATIVSETIRGAVLDALHDYLVETRVALPDASEKGFLKAYRKQYQMPHPEPKEAPSDTRSEGPPDTRPEGRSQGRSQGRSERVSPRVGARAPRRGEAPAVGSGSGSITGAADTPSSPPTPPPTTQTHPDEKPHTAKGTSHPQAARIANIVTAVGWEGPRRTADVTVIWDWAAPHLDHNALETTLAGCVGAAHPNYLRTAASGLAAQAHVTLPDPKDIHA